MTFTYFRDEVERGLIVRVENGEADPECFLVKEHDPELERFFFRYQEHIFRTDRKDMEVDVGVAGMLREL